MSAIPIDTAEDDRLTVYRDLRSPAARRSGEFFVVEGRLLVERLLASGIRVASVLAEERFADTVLPSIPSATPVYAARRALIRELTGFRFHRGALACGYRPASADLRGLLADSPTNQLITVCVGVQELENLGGIIRSSAAFGVRVVVLGEDCADPFSRRVSRTSMGANLQMPIVESVDLASDLAMIKNDFGVQLVATVLDDHARPLQETKTGPRIALLLGNEGRGLPPRWIQACDTRVTIPIQAGIDSLNVSVAAGIALHHFSTSATYA